MKHHSEELRVRWAGLSLSEQLGHAGSEVSRMIKWRDTNRRLANGAFERMLELLDLTLDSALTAPQFKEIARAREVLVATWLGDTPADSPEWRSLNRYFLQFAAAARQWR